MTLNIEKLKRNGEEKFSAEVMNVSSQGVLLKSSIGLAIGSEVEIITEMNQVYDISTGGRIVRSVSDNDGGSLLGIEMILHEDVNSLWENFLAEQAGRALFTDNLPEGM